MRKKVTTSKRHRGHEIDPRVLTGKEAGKTGAQRNGLDSVPLALAKRVYILVGRAIPGCWAAAPTILRPREEGDRKEPSTLSSHFLTSQQPRPHWAHSRGQKRTSDQPGTDTSLVAMKLVPQDKTSSPHLCMPHPENEKVR